MTASKRRKPSSEPLRGWPLHRMRITLGIMGVLIAGLAHAAWQLQIGKNDHYLEAAKRQHLSTMALSAPRGAIRDREGRALAITADAPSIYANPRKVVGVAETAAKLAKLTGVDVRTLEERLSSGRHFVWIRRHVLGEVAEATQAAKLPGISVVTEPRRYYPASELAGPLLGFANIDGKGIEGAELSMNDLLTGEGTERAALRDASGRLMLTGRGEEPEPGATVVLTIDKTIQYIAEQALARAVADNQARAGSIVVLDVDSAEVLALANWPTYNPNNPASRNSARNRAITDAFEMGSVMKLFTIAGALEAGAVSATDTFDIEGGRIRIGRKMIRDSYRDDVLDVGGVLKRSSNVGTIKIARRLGAEGLKDTLDRFGFGRRTEIELPGERAGLVHPTKRWGEIGLAAVSYGYMTMVTPLQVAAGYAAIGNGGVYNEPRIIKEVRGASGEILFDHKPMPRRVISEQTTRVILPMLASVFDKGRDGGTARNIDVDGYPAGGKTGTAHKVDPATKKYADELYLSTFAGLAPIDDPKVAVVVLIDEPKGEHYYGSQVAGPAFAEVVAESLRYLGVPASEAEVDHPASSEDEGARERIISAPTDDFSATPEVPPSLARDAQIPDFRGRSVAAVLTMARDHGLPIVIEGSGIAVEQFPLPGPRRHDTQVRVVFSPETSSRSSLDGMIALP